MRISRRGTVAAVAALTTTAVLSGCGATSAKPEAGHCLDSIKSQGTLRVGTVSNLPIDAIDTSSGQMTGFNGDMLKDFVKDTGIAKNVAATALPFSSLVPSLNANKIDITSDTMFATPEREKQISFTNVILYNPEGLIVQSGNPKNLHQLSDFHKGESIGTYQGTVWVDWVNELQAKQGVRAQVFPSVADLMQAISAKQVDGGLMSAAIASYTVSKNKGIGVELASGYTPRSRQGVATHLGVQKGCTDLATKFNEWYLSYVQDGRMSKNLENWGVQPIDNYLDGVAGYTKP